MRRCKFVSCSRPLVCALLIMPLGWLSSTQSAFSQPPVEEDFSRELPRIAPVEPAAALATIKVQPGFRVEQVAAEPLVASPVAIAFDENSRLYVVEMRDYSEQKEDFLGRIRLLEDLNGDGRFEKSTIFAEKLSWPTAVACYDGGIFVGAAPDIIYLKDTNGDGRADVRRVVFTGFGKTNVQGLLNSFAWTLDNRIEGATSSSGGSIKHAEHPDAPTVEVRGRDFSIDPRGLWLTPTSGGAQHGLSYDNWGHKFVSSNSDHIQQVMYEDRYIARNPYLTAPSPRLSIAADGPQAEVYRASPIEPWRIVRTRLRVSGAVKGAVEGGGRPAGYFTGATGVTIYRGNAFPDSLLGMAVVGDVGSNLVHRKLLALDGLRFTATRMDKASEFVASSDIWFRPAQFANAPDGTLYIVDVYREVIEHPDSLPPMIKKHLDLTSGRDRGRIYRVVPNGFRQPALPQLGRASTAELVATLESPNAWHRETASRLLFERQDTGALEPLNKLAAESASPLARMHALYALAGLKALASGNIILAITDRDANVRRHAVRLAEHVDKGSHESQLTQRLLTMVEDDDLQVRYQLAFTLGELSPEVAVGALATLARRDAEDPWMRMAIQSSLVRDADVALGNLLGDDKFRRSAGGRLLLVNLARQLGLSSRKQAKGDADAALIRALGALSKLPKEDSSLARSIVRSASEGLARQGRSLKDVVKSDSTARASQILEDLLSDARTTALDEKRPVKDRSSAIESLVLGSFIDAREMFPKLIDQRQDQEIQQAALTALSRFSDPAVTPLLLEVWPTLSPRLRVLAGEALFARRDRLLALLDAVEKGQFQASDLEPARVQALTTYPDPAIRQRAAKLLANVKLGRRQDVVEAYRSALIMKGDTTRGKAIFQKICAACHRADNVGHEIGPNLATIKNRGAETILLNVLDPSREVNPQYVNYVLVTDDGRSMTGMISAETATSVTLKRAEGATDTVLRINIDEMRSTGLSIMPEGMEKQLDQQGLADVIAYLLTIK
jgi:putative membrane-bound dehydrogenase-like protein